MFWSIIGVTTVIAGGSALVIHFRGKAKVGDQVMFRYRPVIPGINLGDQALELTGRVVEKKDPVTGPFYDIQLFSTPQVGNPEIAAALATMPSIIRSVPDKDIVRKV